MISLSRFVEGLIEVPDEIVDKKEDQKDAPPAESRNEYHGR